ncbi:transposase [Candidatus Pacearchaeota archaeon]|nr:transposase [Candidatus Pacearchaeota archaeon]
MLSRWITEIHDLNFALNEIKRLTQRLIRKKEEKRGRPPKHNPVEYVQLIVLKEFCDTLSLRKAEVRLSEFVVGERVDHSVIAYWENKPEITRCMQIVISRAGRILDKYLRKIFSFIDATKFTTWTIEEVQIHVANRIAQETVYPIGVSFLKKNIRDPTNEALPSGYGRVYADAGYDDNKTIKVLFEKGYYPIVCPNKNRWKGHWRKKARKLYRMPVNRRGYRHRGRGESVFGSLTNEFGDRLHARNEQSLQARVLSRIISYQIKLLIRCNNKIIIIDVLIIRHAQTEDKFKYFYGYYVNGRNRKITKYR